MSGCRREVPGFGSRGLLGVWRLLVLGGLSVKNTPNPKPQHVGSDPRDFYPKHGTCRGLDGGLRGLKGRGM